MKRVIGTGGIFLKCDGPESSLMVRKHLGIAAPLFRLDRGSREESYRFMGATQKAKRNPDAPI